MQWWAWLLIVVGTLLIGIVILFIRSKTSPLLKYRNKPFSASQAHSEAIFLDEHQKKINHWAKERIEQEHALRFIPSDATVLELGARYGTTSSAIQRKLADGKRHVAIEPDDRVLSALEQNRQRNKDQYAIERAILAKPSANKTLVKAGYGTKIREQKEKDKSVVMETLTLDELQNKHHLKFDTLVADCEGCLPSLFEDFPPLFDQLRLILLEKDGGRGLKQQYRVLDQKLEDAGFRRIEKIFIWEVWSKK